jgi:putative hydrolase of the HAD superfamily
VWVSVLAALDGRVSRDAVRRAWSLAFEPNPAVLAVIDLLGAPAALLTNNGPIVDEILDNELFDVGRRFCWRLLSCRLGAMKPHPDAFRNAALAIGESPEQLVLVDDSPINVAAARAAGWLAFDVYRPDP